jgi:hypothetical protein
VHLPDPLARFAELHRAVLGPRRWYERDDASRHAALLLVPLPGTPAELARALEARAEELRRALSWWSSLRANVRFVLAALLVREGLSARAMMRAIDEARVLFRRHWRWSGHPWQELAALVLLMQGEERRVTPAEVARLAAIWERMRRDHPWLTQRSDWPACAALVARPEPVEQLAARLEACYRGLGEAGLARGDARQTAAQILCFAPGEPAALCARFGRLWRAFREAGLWMHSGDYDEVALLAFADAPATAVVERVLRHRAAIDALRPRPTRSTSFDLACGTALLELLREARGGEAEAARRIEAIARLVAVLQVQQAAVAAATSGGAVAATAG